MQWIDLEKFAATPVVSVAPVNVVLSHLNPLFATLPRLEVQLGARGRADGPGVQEQRHAAAAVIA